MTRIQNNQDGTRTFVAPPVSIPTSSVNNTNVDNSSYETTPDRNDPFRVREPQPQTVNPFTGEVEAPTTSYASNTDPNNPFFATSNTASTRPTSGNNNPFELNKPTQNTATAKYQYDTSSPQGSPNTNYNYTTKKGKDKSITAQKIVDKANQAAVSNTKQPYKINQIDTASFATNTNNHRNDGQASVVSPLNTPLPPQTDPNNPFVAPSGQNKPNPSTTPSQPATKPSSATLPPKNNSQPTPISQTTLDTPILSQNDLNNPFTASSKQNQPKPSMPVSQPTSKPMSKPIDSKDWKPTPMSRPVRPDDSTLVNDANYSNRDVQTMRNAYRQEEDGPRKKQIAQELRQTPQNHVNRVSPANSIEENIAAVQKRAGENVAKTNNFRTINAEEIARDVQQGGRLSSKKKVQAHEKAQREYEQEVQNLQKNSEYQENVRIRDQEAKYREENPTITSHFFDETWVSDRPKSAAQIQAEEKINEMSQKKYDLGQKATETRYEARKSQAKIVARREKLGITEASQVKPVVNSTNSSQPNNSKVNSAQATNSGRNKDNPPSTPATLAVPVNPKPGNNGGGNQSSGSSNVRSSAKPATGGPSIDQSGTSRAKAAVNNVSTSQPDKIPQKPVAQPTQTGNVDNRPESNGPVINQSGATTVKENVAKTTAKQDQSETQSEKNNSEELRRQSAQQEQEKTAASKEKSIEEFRKNREAMGPEREKRRQRRQASIEAAEKRSREMQEDIKRMEEIEEMRQRVRQDTSNQDEERQSQITTDELISGFDKISYGNVDTRNTGYSTRDLFKEMGEVNPWVGRKIQQVKDNLNYSKREKEKIYQELVDTYIEQPEKFKDLAGDGEKGEKVSRRRIF